MKHLSLLTAAFLGISFAVAGGVAQAAVPAPSTSSGSSELGTVRLSPAFGSTSHATKPGVTERSPDQTRYASRAKDSKGLEKFRGGDGVSIYLGGSAVAIALLVVILIILL